MKKKILVIFFISFIFCILIYKKFIPLNNNILLISDNEIVLNNSYFKNYNIIKYNYNNLTYKDLLKNIKNNDYKIIKEEIIYLNQLIRNSNIIILNINNDEYFNKCRKNSVVLNYYDDILSGHINDLISVINKISSAKILVVSNYCKKNNHVQRLNIKESFINYFDAIDKNYILN